MVFSIKVFQSMADNVKAIIREDNSQVGWLAASLNFHRAVPQNQHFVRSRASNNSSLSLRKINPLNCEYSRNSSFSRIVCICHFASIGLPKRGACLTLWRPELLQMEYLSLRDQYFLFITCFSFLEIIKNVRSVWRRLSECSQGIKFYFFSNDRGEQRYAWLFLKFVQINYF